MARLVVKTVAVTVGGKINLGNYNSLQIDQTRWADIALEEGEELSMDEVDSLVDGLEKAIRQQLLVWATEKAEPKHKITEKVNFAGKPVEDEDDYNSYKHD